MKKQKLSLWAKENGITYKTAWNWIKSNNFPEKYTISKTGHYFVIINDNCIFDNNQSIVDKLISIITTLCTELYGPENGISKANLIKKQIVEQ